MVISSVRHAAFVVGIDNMASRALQPCRCGWASGQSKERRGSACNSIGTSIKIGEAKAFRRHAVDIGRANAGMTVAAEIAVAEVVGENDDDIGTLAFRMERERKT